MQVQLEKIPQFLKDTNQFCNWKYELRDGNHTKVPYTPGTTRKANVNYPATFTAFDTAVSATGYDGIRIFCLLPDGFTYDTKTYYIKKRKCRGLYSRTHRQMSRSRKTFKRGCSCYVRPSPKPRHSGSTSIPSSHRSKSTPKSRN